MSTTLINLSKSQKQTLLSIDKEMFAKFLVNSFLKSTYYFIIATIISTS